MTNARGGCILSRIYIRNVSTKWLAARGEEYKKTGESRQGRLRNTILRAHAYYIYYTYMRQANEGRARFGIEYVCTWARQWPCVIRLQAPPS